MTGEMHIVSPLAAGNESRHCRQDGQRDGGRNDGECEASTNKNNDSSRKRSRPKETEDMVTPSATTTSPAVIREEFRENETRELDPSSSLSPHQWWFSRHSLPASLHRNTTNIAIADDPSWQAPGDQRTTASGMVLSEHLGRVHNVVESLTHDVNNWSLTRLSAATSATGENRHPTHSGHARPPRKKEQQKRCKEAQRRVRMARRRCLEEQQRLRASPAQTTDGTG